MRATNLISGGIAGTWLILRGYNVERSTDFGQIGDFWMGPN